MCRGRPRIAINSVSVSITSSLVMPRSTFKAKHSRVYSSTTDSHYRWLPLAVLSNTRPQHHTSLGVSARRRWHPLALDLKRRLFTGTFSPPAATIKILETTQHAILLLEAASQFDNIHTAASLSPTAAPASRAAARPCGA